MSLPEFHHYKESPRPGCSCFECLASEPWLGGISDGERKKALEAVNNCRTNEDTSGCVYPGSSGQTQAIENDENKETADSIKDDKVSKKSEVHENDRKVYDQKFTIDLQAKYMQNIKAAAARRRDANQSVQYEAIPSKQPEVIQNDQHKANQHTQRQAEKNMPADRGNEPVYYGTPNRTDVNCENFNKIQGCQSVNCVRRHACAHCHEAGHNYLNCWKLLSKICPWYNSYWGCAAHMACPLEHICSRCRLSIHPAYVCHE